MTIAGYQVKLEKRVGLTTWQAAWISILAILIALALFSLLFVLAGINPITAYHEIFSYAFANPFGLPLTINRFIFLLLTTYAFIIPFRAGLWNIGMAGQFYAGALGAYAVLYFIGIQDFNSSMVIPILIIPLMLVAAAFGGAVLGSIAGFLKGKYNVNEIVVTMMLNFLTFWLVSFNG